MIIFATLRNIATGDEMGGIIYDPQYAVLKRSSRGKYHINCTEVELMKPEEEKEHLAIEHSRRFV